MLVHVSAPHRLDHGCYSALLFYVAVEEAKHPVVPPRVNPVSSGSIFAVVCTVSTNSYEKQKKCTVFSVLKTLLYRNDSVPRLLIHAVAVITLSAFHMQMIVISPSTGV